MELIQGFGLFIVNNAPALAGILLPPVVDYIAKDVKNEAERWIVTVLACIFVSILIHWNELLNGSPFEFAKYMTLIFFESQTIFKLYFKNSYLRYGLMKLYIQPDAVDQVIPETQSTTVPPQT